MRQKRNELRWLTDAKVKARRSKDPSTQVGALIVRPDDTEASHGYNGLPRGVEDTLERLTNRDLKYPMTVHAELNAILVAREPLHGYSLYCTLSPCAGCAGAIIQAGIKRVVAIRPTEAQLERWGASFDLMKMMFREANVEFETYPEREVIEQAGADGIAFFDPKLAQVEHGCGACCGVAA